MAKIQAKKMKMTQVWKNDRVIAVSPLKLKAPEETEAFKEGD